VCHAIQFQRDAPRCGDPGEVAHARDPGVHQKLLDRLTLDDLGWNLVTSLLGGEPVPRDQRRGQSRRGAHRRSHGVFLPTIRKRD
jgi:hypothetical protein